MVPTASTNSALNREGTSHLRSKGDGRRVASIRDRDEPSWEHGFRYAALDQDSSEANGVQASLAITLDHIIISVYGPEGPITSARPTGSPGVNSWRISELEKLAREARHGLAP